MRIASAMAGLVAVGIACGPGQQAMLTVPPDGLDQFDREAARSPLEHTLDSYIAAIGEDWGPAYQFSGHVHVVRGRRVLYSRGFGFADHALRTPNTADTSFRVGSVTKQFTATAVLVLEQQGKLAVGDSVRKHLPGYPAAGDRIAIHQLLTHTAGLPDYTRSSELRDSRDRAHTPDELLAAFRDQPLEFAPGERFAYSNSGYVLLGAIIEAASGTSYAEFLRGKLFEPAGLAHTVAGDADGTTDRALGYEVTAREELALAHPIDMSVPYAAGGVRSTARDLVRWHRALADGKILTAKSRAKLAAPDRVAGGYAYGWAIRTERSRVVLEHDGGIDGFTTTYVRVPQDDLVIVVWSNNGIPTKPIADAAMAAAYGLPVEPPTGPRPRRIEPAIVGRVQGRYEIDEASRKAALAAGLTGGQVDAMERIEIRGGGGFLRMELTESATELPLRALEGTPRFINRPTGVEVEFEFERAGDAVPSAGNASALTMRRGPLTLRYTRT